MIGYAIVLNLFAALYLILMVSMGGATTMAFTPIVLMVISIVVLVIALKRYGRSV